MPDSKVRMVSHTKHTYKTRVVQPNDEFEVDNEQDADDLEVLGMAKREPKRRGRPPGTYKRSDMRAEEE
jgi:hypothetical protein